MRKLALTVALAAAATLTAPLVQRAEAGAIRPAPLGAALDGTTLVEPVHCRPGRAHHSSFRTPDGCEGRKRYSTRYRYQPYAYSPYAYQPYAYGYPYAQPYPRAYGYAPGITFGFNVGPRYPHW
jgi:hypothetical protein